MTETENLEQAFKRLTPDWANGQWSGYLVELEAGYKWHIDHDVLGDMYLVEWSEAEPFMSSEAFNSIWELIDEDIFTSKKSALDAIRAWVKTAALEKN